MRKGWIGFVLLTVCMAVCAGSAARAEGDLFERAPWSLSLGGGAILYEGDEEVENGGFLQLKLGYDLSPRWTLEAD
ncbi:MAG: hypothetical protein EOM20_21635, partial [Spartobacteria bacterium]|nr:hypothetical protein [Spartobacteria bacterium]